MKKNENKIKCIIEINCVYIYIYVCMCNVGICFFFFFFFFFFFIFVFFFFFFFFFFFNLNLLIYLIIVILFNKFSNKFSLVILTKFPNHNTCQTHIFSIFSTFTHGLNIIIGNVTNLVTSVENSW